MVSLDFAPAGGYSLTSVFPENLTFTFSASDAPLR